MPKCSNSSARPSHFAEGGTSLLVHLGEHENLTLPEAQRAARFSRTTLYKAMHADPAYRGGLPERPSLRIGRARRIRVATLQA